MKEKYYAIATDEAGRRYEDGVHRAGRIWMWSAAVLLILFPCLICLYFNAWPPISSVFQGLLSVAPIFWTVGLIETFTYIPMMGAGGSYLGFVTGNLANLKVPCALGAMERAGVRAGTEEGELISTISIAVSSLVTTVVILLGVVLIVPLTPILESPALQPAFDNILPAWFGALGVVFISKNWKIAAAPLVVMVALFICVPSLTGMVGLLVPVGAAIAIGAARILYKNGKI